MSEPIGWNVYYGTGGQHWRFAEFLPNEPVLAREAERFAGQVEEFTWQPEQAGTLTPEIVGRALDEMSRPLLAGSFEVSGTIALEFAPGAAEALMEMFRPRCGALLFPLPPRALIPVEPVHPLDVPYFAPVQGPQPAACALDRDHRIGWHWCDGTWWKA